MSIKNLVCQIVILIGILTILVNEKHDSFSCFFIILISFLSLTMDVVSSGCISVLRYHMITKAKETKIFPSENAKKFTLLNISLTVMFLAFHWVMYSKFEIVVSPIQMCLYENYNVKGRIEILNAPNMIPLVFWTVIGLIYDVFLTKELIKRSKESNQKRVGIIPWKSSNKSESAEVPIKATIISSLTLFLVFMIVSIILKSRISGTINAWKNIIAINTLFLIRLPIILIFTINHNKGKDKKKNLQQPPNSLQFVEENLSKNQSEEIDSDNGGDNLETGNSIPLQQIHDEEHTTPRIINHYVTKNCRF